LKTTTINKPSTCVGLANGSAVLSASLFDNNALNAIVVFWGGTVYKNGSFVFSNDGALGTNKVLRVAWDADNHHVWFAVDAGMWNGSATANPETDTEGQLTVGFDSNGLFPLFAGSDNAQACTANFGVAAFAYALPSGFSAWNAS